jgi:V-type H+-transporting ATPase subunit D
MKLKKEAAAKADSDKENEEAVTTNPDILGEQEDQDVIF